MQIQTDEMRQAMGEADGVVCVAAPRKAATNRRCRDESECQMSSPAIDREEVVWYFLNQMSD